jgi:hypothetical protein
VKLNGTALAATNDLSEPFPNPDPPLLGTPETLVAWTVPAKLLRDGANRLEVILESGPAVEIAFIDIVVN